MKIKKIKKNLSLVLLVLVIVALAVGGVIYVKRRNKFANNVVPVQQYSWKKDVNVYYDQAQNASAPVGDFGTFSQDFLVFLRKTLSDDVKLAQSSDEKLTYVSRTIIVESDSINVKKYLEQKGYQNVQIARDYSTVKGEKGNEKIEVDMSVKTLSKGEVTVIRQVQK